MHFDLPPDHVEEPSSIPDFWVSALEDIEEFLLQSVRRGSVATLGTSAGGRPIRAVSYGQARVGRGTTTFSGSLGYGDVRAYLGPDHDKKVYVALGAVHGGEFEGVVGIVNLLSILETGADLRGKPYPEIVEAAAGVDRLILVPVVNVDGRARLPMRMARFTDQDNSLHQYLNTGANLDGTNLGWPQCKEFIPLDFATVEFPGGYPNDAGVNLQHDDFLGKRQPETQALLELCARERPDLILNMHTGAPPRNYYTRMHRPLIEPRLQETFDALYRAVHGGLTEAGLQGTRDLALETDVSAMPVGTYNLDTALNLHCGALAVLIEAPSHGFAGLDREGSVVVQTPDLILDAQLVCHCEALRFLGQTGGRSRWLPGR